MAEAVVSQMLCHRPPCRLYGIGLGLNIAGHTACMASPVIQKPGHMNHIPGPVRQPKNHIVILTAVKPCPKQLFLLQKTSGKATEMADIIIGSQIIRCIIRLKMKSQHFIDVPILKGGFVTVNIICLLLINHLHILIQYAGM